MESDCGAEEGKYRDAVWEIFQAETKYLTCQLQPLEQVKLSIITIYQKIKSLIQGNTDSNDNDH